MNEYIAKNHTFVICAYKESEFLEACICSLKSQTVSSNIIMTTSTPNSFISGLAEKYEIPLFVRDGESDIAQDWNFAYKKADNQLITIAHQDDIYEETYVENMLTTLNKAKNPLIYFNDYYELRNGKRVDTNTLLKVKRFLLLPLRIKYCQRSVFWKKRVLSLGNPILCPSVTYVREQLPTKLFKTGFRSNIDWQTWVMLAKLNGQFAYSLKRLTAHRIHENSETSVTINGSIRRQEDEEMLRQFWPNFLVKILIKYYVRSEKSNQITDASRK